MASISNIRTPKVVLFFIGMRLNDQQDDRHSFVMQLSVHKLIVDFDLYSSPFETVETSQPMCDLKYAHLDKILSQVFFQCSYVDAQLPLS